MDEQTKKARKKALDLLTDRDRSVHELTEKLQKAGFEEEEVRDAIAYVESFGYLDDKKYALHYINFYRQSRSDKRLEFDLIKKGIDKSVISQAFEEAGEQDQKPLIRELLRKKMAHMKGDPEENRQKLAAAMLRKGFRMGDILTVLNELKLEEKYDLEEG